MSIIRDRRILLAGGFLAFGILGLDPAVPGRGRAGAEDPASGAMGVSALGRIEPEDGVLHIGAPSMVNAVSGSIVRRLLVKAGEDVKEGQLLAETDNAPVEAAAVLLHQAEVELAAREAEAALGEEQDVCSRSEVAQRTSARRTNLRRSGVTSDEEADVAAGDAKALSGSCHAARLATKAAASAVDVAKAKVQRAEAEYARTQILAPADGRVLRIIHHPGELVVADGVLEFGRVQRMYAIAEVYETDIRRVKVGQKATVTAEALEKPLAGVVETIRLQVRKHDATGTDPAARKDARIVEVEVLLDRPEAVASLSNLQVEVLLHP
ncbi:MAG: efflux RND transporter periplasmic adaptor subunit [Candidatus Binatia bacterium]